jgi:hypothetical protein
MLHMLIVDAELRYREELKAATPARQISRRARDRPAPQQIRRCSLRQVVCLKAGRVLLYAGTQLVRLSRAGSVAPERMTFDMQG